MKKLFSTFAYVIAVGLLSQALTTQTAATGPILSGFQAQPGDVIVTAGFLGDSRRLSRLAVEVRNNSQKSIAYLQASVPFTGVKVGEADLVLPFTFGSLPETGLASERFAKPGDVVALSARPDTIRRTEEVLSERGYVFSATQKIPVRLGAVIFTDGTALYGGLIHVRDPKDPNRWTAVGTGPTNASLVLGRERLRVKFAASAKLGSPLFACKRVTGFEVLPCCISGTGNLLHVISATFVDDPNGDATPRLTTACCGPSGSGCCDYYEVDPCS